MLKHYENKMLTVPENKTFVLIASGPSLTKENVEYCKKKAQIIVINDNYKIAPWADYLYACDQQWWLWHEDDPDLLAFRGQKYTQNQAWDPENLARISQKHRLTVLNSKGSSGLSPDPGIIHTGQNSGYQAINLAYHLGAKRVLLLGYDMQPTNNKWHWFGDHPTQIKSPFHKFIKEFDSIAKHPQGMEIINCSLETALTCFPRQHIEDAL